jgi:hypothetical protein
MPDLVGILKRRKDPSILSVSLPSHCNNSRQTPSTKQRNRFPSDKDFCLFVSSSLFVSSRRRRGAALSARMLPRGKKERAQKPPRGDHVVGSFPALPALSLGHSLIITVIIIIDHRSIAIRHP